jgi:hypothetical protein
MLRSAGTTPRCAVPAAVRLLLAAAAVAAHEVVQGVCTHSKARQNIRAGTDFEEWSYVYTFT